MKKAIVLLVLCLSYVVDVNAQRTKDFSVWTWNQFYYHFDKSHYASFQYQSRFNENASLFDCANLYFVYGYNPDKKSNLEFLYQLKTDNRRDLHTLYVGYTRKIKVRSVNFYTRIAFQHNRNFFSMNEFYDQSFNEFRLRVRAKYDLNKIFSTAISAEPTFELSGSDAPYLDKIRYVFQTSMQYNKFNSFTLFYIYQPDYYSNSALETNYVLGLSYEVSIRGKVKSIKKFVKPDMKPDDDEKWNNKNHPENL